MPTSPPSESIHDASALPDAAFQFPATTGGAAPDSLRTIVLSEIQAIAGEHGRNLGPLSDDTPLIDTGLDSFCLAVLVVRLEDRLHVDPFSNPDEAAFPVTLGDFVQLYKDAGR